MIDIQVEDRAVLAALAELRARATNLRPAMVAIAEDMKAASDRAFATNSNPATGAHWADYRPSTLRARAKRGRSPNNMLRLSGWLASSIHTVAGDDYAVVGTNVRYAAIHQFGGSIERAPWGGTVRLRTDRDGNLLRQGKGGRLAVFAKDSHKRAVVRRFETGPYSVRIPARPFLGLGAHDLRTILGRIQAHLQAALHG